MSRKGVAVETEMVCELVVRSRTSTWLQCWTTWLHGLESDQTRAAEASSLVRRPADCSAGTCHQLTQLQRAACSLSSPLCKVLRAEPICSLSVSKHHACCLWVTKSCAPYHAALRGT